MITKQGLGRAAFKLWAYERLLQ